MKYVALMCVALAGCASSPASEYEPTSLSGCGEVEQMLADGFVELVDQNLIAPEVYVACNADKNVEVEYTPQGKTGRYVDVYQGGRYAGQFRLLSSRRL